MGSRARARVKEKNKVELGFGMGAGRTMNEGLGTHLGPDSEVCVNMDIASSNSNLFSESVGSVQDNSTSGFLDPRFKAQEARLHKGDMETNSFNFSIFPAKSSVNVTHFNFTFEDMGSVDVPLNNTVLDLEKHSIVTFKDNSNPNKSTSSSDNVTVEGAKVTLVLKTAMIKVAQFALDIENEESREGLSSIIPPRGVPWAAIDDFNTLLSSSDKKEVDELE
ncbi:hypothetical protein Gogos_012029 [Gossypium gossypioides]|uniref:Uncharacterized protein n=1 Tax=Gossypium gossypioides TaxID=34282 RepID=A0A7J9BR88_GOSGO|nr:hypothetical protein [Gossypium gossypioides]